MLPFIAKDLSLNYSQAGFLGASLSLGTAVFAIPSGFISTKIGGFKLLTILLLIYSLGSLEMSLSPNIFFLIFAFFLGAVGFGMFHTTGFILTARNSKKAKMGKNMGDFSSIGEIGRVALPPLAVFATPLLGWRLTMGMVSAVGLIAFVILKLFSKTSEDRNSQVNKTEENHKEFIKSLLDLFKLKKFIFVSVTAIIDAFASNPIVVYLPFLILVKGLNPQQLAASMALLFIGSLFGKSILGRISDKTGSINVFIISEISMALVLILVTNYSNFFLLLALCFALGIFTKGTSPVIQAMFSQITHETHYNKVYSMSEVFIGTASVLTISIMGFLADKLGVGAVFYICSALGILAVIPIYFYKKSEKRQLKYSLAKENPEFT